MAQVSRRLRAFRMGWIALSIGVAAAVCLTPQSAYAEGTWIPAPDVADVAYDAPTGILYMTARSSVLRWSMAQRKFLSPLRVTGADFKGIDISPDGKLIALTNESSGAGLYLLDSSKGTVAPVAGTPAAREIAVTAGSNVLFAPFASDAKVYRYNLSTRRVTIVAGPFMDPKLASSADGRFAAWTDTGFSDGMMGWFRVSDQKVNAHRTNEYNYDVAISRDASEFAFSSSGGVVICNNNLDPIGVRIGGRALAYHPKRDLVYGSLLDSDTVAVYDTRDYSLTNTRNLQGYSRQIEVSRDGKYLFAVMHGGVMYTDLARSFTGTVSSSYHGLPVASARIGVYRTVGDEWSRVATLTANAQGAWSYATEATAATRFAVTDPAGGHDSRWIGSDPSTATSYVLRPDGVTTVDTTLAVTPGATIGGRVVDRLDDPIAGATVTLFAAKGDAQLESTTTGPGGDFVFGDLPPATYHIGISETGTQPAAWFHPGKLEISRAAVVTIGTARNVDLGDCEPPPAPHFGGTVRDSSGKPLGGIVVRAYDAATLWETGSGAPAVEVTTAPDGGFVLGGVDADRLYVIAYCDRSDTRRDSVWPGTGWHIADSWAATPTVESGPRHFDARLATVASVMASRGVRVAGADRYSTSLATSRKSFDTAATVVLAGGAGYADALAASPLAGVTRSPVILVRPDRLDAATLAELRRLRTQNVVIVGGVSAVSQAVANSLSRAGLKVRRISGANRYEVASKVALEVYSRTPNKEPFVVRGDVFTDALSVSSFAYMQRRPILLCPTEGMNKPVRDAWIRMHRGAGDTAVFVGGPASITDDMYHDFREVSGAALDSRNVWIWNKSSPDRYGTSQAVVAFFQDYYYQLVGGFDFVGLASGEVFADALSGGAASGHRGGPLVLTNGRRLSPAARSSISGSGPYALALQAYGGTAALSDSTLGTARQALGSWLYDIDQPIVAGTLTNRVDAVGPAILSADAIDGRTLNSEPHLPDTAPMRRQPGNLLGD